MHQNPNRAQAGYIFDQDSLNLIVDRNVQFIARYNLPSQNDLSLDFANFYTQAAVPSMINQKNRILMPQVSGKQIDFYHKISALLHLHFYLEDGDSFYLDTFGQYGPYLLFEFTSCQSCFSYKK